MNNPAQIEVIVQRGYQPSKITLPANTPARLTFLRKESSACSREVIIPALGIKKELPQNVPVEIDLPALEEGAYSFTCGMMMMKGEIEVEAQSCCCR